MRLLLAATCLLLASVASAADPVTLPFEALAGEITIHAKVDGVDRRLALALESPYSYMKDGTGEPVKVEAGTLTLGPVRFAMPTETQKKVADGAIGLDLLRGMAIGVDEFRRTVTLWPRGATPTTAAAEAWTGDLPSWGGPVRVRRTPLGTLIPSGTLSVEAAYPETRGPALLTLDIFATSLEPAFVPQDARLPGGRTLAWGTPTSESLPSWTVAYPVPDGALTNASPDIHAIVAANALGARRTLVDLAANALFSEDLPEDIRLSRFLTAFTRASLEIRGDGLILQLPPGADPSRETAVADVQGTTVVRLAGLPAKEWLDALRARSTVAAHHLAVLLLRLFDPFEIVVRLSDGKERTISVPVA